MIEKSTACTGICGNKSEFYFHRICRTLLIIRSNDISSIFVHPPTPERDSRMAPQENPIASLKTEEQISMTPSPRDSPISSPMSALKTLPTVYVPSPPPRTLPTMPVPLQVLPEVRSPPRRNIAMAADSLQLTGRRGRRPRLFGFTEMPDGSGSSCSSAAGSRQTSPERSSSPLHSPLATPPGPGGSSDFIPRRHPIRAKSETNLHTVTGAMSSSKLATKNPNTDATPSTSALHSVPRKRENGLKLDFTGIIPLSSPSNLSDSVVASPYSARLIRKKSGEILKPALKYGGPLAANGTPLEGPRTDISPDSPSSARFESKSCPTTPSCPKYVHFDTQLERVKLFLHDQKPQVVSRTGSPSEHYTTSEGEEYPFPSTDEERDDRKVLQIKLPNFPTHHAPDEDLYLESLFLDDDRKNMRGIIMCRNLAFQKWVAVRFTLDFWQTTSEVTATFKDSVRGGKYDRFTFTIKMQDIIPRIEEKTMFLAIRYTTDGREIWDSNGGQNYQVLFEKVRLNPVVTVPKRNSVSIQPGMGKSIGGRTSQWSVTGGNADDRLADLRAKLSRLTADDLSFSPPQLSPNRERNFSFAPGRRPLGVAGSPSGSPARSFSSLDARTSDLPTAGGALAARYDFGQALKTTRRLSPNLQKVELPDVQTGLLNYKANNGQPATEFYSPRFSPNRLPDTPLPSDFVFGNPIDSPQNFDSPAASSPLATPSLQIQEPSPPLPDETVRTPVPASPKRPALNRARTTPAAIQSPSPRESPPSLDDPSGSDRDTPSESPKSPPDFSLPRWSPTSASSEKSDMSHASYSSFIEQ